MKKKSLKMDPYCGGVSFLVSDTWQVRADLLAHNCDNRNSRLEGNTWGVNVCTFFEGRGVAFESFYTMHK